MTANATYPKHTGYRKYTGPTAEEISRVLHGRRERDGGYRVPGVCHTTAASKSGALKVWNPQDGGLAVRCFAGCERRNIIAALESSTGWTIWDAWESRPPNRPDSPGMTKSGVSTKRFKAPENGAPVPETTSPRKSPPSKDRMAYARQLWAKSKTIPPDESHPARRWLAARNLWRPAFPLPAPVRWLAAADSDRRHTGAGSLVGLAAPPLAWMLAWPGLPDAHAVQSIAIAPDGSPALDRPADAVDRNGEPSPGLPKRTRGVLDAVVCLLGYPGFEDAAGPVRVAEGLADALALASRFPAPSLALLGTSGYSSPAVAAWLAAWLAAWPDGVIIHADQDGPGHAAAAKLRLAVKDAGGSARAVLTAVGKDSADVAEANDFATLNDTWADYARTLREMYPDWPRYEVARQASILTLGD